MIYVAVFLKEKNGFGVTFPDFPECSTFGESLDEAVDQAHEALSLFVEMWCDAGKDLPDPTPKKIIMSKPENREAKAINIDVAGDSSDFEAVELVMHSYLLGRIEKYCAVHGVSPADFLAVAARDALRADVFGNE